MLTRSTPRLLLSLLAALLVAACGQGGSAGSGRAALYPVTTIQLSVGAGTSSTASLSAPEALSGFADVTRVSIEVDGPDAYGVTQNPLATAELSKSADGVWSGSLAGLTVGPSLTFTGRAYDASGTLVFSGVTSQSLSNATSVSIALQPVGTGVQLTFPRIVSISLPGEIQTASQATVTAAVQGSTGETLSYAFQSDTDAGSFDLAQGNVTLPAGSSAGTVTSTYTAPETAGSHTATLTLTNSQGNAVQSDFPLTVVDGSGDGGVTVGFAPVVHALIGQRDGSAVRWWAIVTDDKALSQLSYAWSFSQSAGTDGAAFTDASSNPGLLSGYDATVAGTVSLKVTDGDGLSTTVSFALVAGQFPDVVVFHPPVAHDDTAQTASADPLTLNVLANDTDADGDTLSVSAVSAPQHGTVTNNGDGTLSYTPDTGFNGADAFTYTVSDGHGGYDTATVTILVTIDAQVGSGSVIGAGTVLGAGVVVSHDVVIGEACSLGAGTEVSHSTRIGAHCALGASDVIDHNVSIGSDAQLGDSTQISHNTTLGDAVQLGAHVSLDHNVTVGDSVQVGDNTQIGHDVQIDAGATLGAGVVVGHNAHIPAGVTVPDGTQIPANTDYSGMR